MTCDEKGLHVFQAAVGHLILLAAEASRHQRDPPVRRVGRDNDQLVRLLLVVLQRKHLGLDQHLPDVLREGVHELPDEVDPGLVDPLLRDVDLAEGVQVGHFPEHRVVVGAEIVDQDLPEVPAVLLLLGLLDLERLLERLVVDDALLQQREADLVCDVNMRHDSTAVASLGDCRAQATGRTASCTTTCPRAGFFGRIVAVSDDTIVRAVRTIIMTIEIASWMKSIAFRILYVVSFS